jgi:tol-pal system protein YbgF
MPETGGDSSKLKTDDVWCAAIVLFLRMLPNGFGDKMMSMLRIGFIMIIVAALFSGCATRQDVDHLNQRLWLLEKENRDLKQRVSQVNETLDSRKQSENGIRDLYADQYAEFDRIREEFRRIDGRIEETAHLTAVEIEEAGNVARHARDAAATNDGRLRRVEKYLGFEAAESPEESGEGAAAVAPGAPAAPGATAAAPVASEATESQVYSAAKQVYDQGDWEEAFRLFGIFLKKYPASALADNARFWIGEIYYNQGLFKQAIIEYQIIIETYPNGNKVPAAYLKQGISFHNLGENSNARLALQELIRRFPDSNEAGIARKYMTRLQ